MKTDVTLLVSSCDQDEDTWYPFFKLLECYWKNKPDDWPIVLNTETKTYAYGNYDIKCMGDIKRKKHSSWTKRLYNVVKRIETPFIILTLSDYFIIDNVDQNRLDKCLDFIRSNKNVAYISLYPNESCEKEAVESKLVGFDKCIKGSPFVVNAQMGIWNREALLKLLYGQQSAWEWEENASEYSFYLDYDFYTASDNEKLIFPYDWRADGYSVCARKWTRNCKKLFCDNEIDIDLSIRGVWDPKELHPSVPQKSKIKHLFRPPFIKRCVKKIGYVIREKNDKNKNFMLD